MTNLTSSAPRRACAVLNLLLATCCIGCGGVDPHPPMVGDPAVDGEGGEGSDVPDGYVAARSARLVESDTEEVAGEEGADGCIDGALLDCTVILGEHEGVVTCYAGVRVCVDGRWGPCGEHSTPDDGDQPEMKAVSGKVDDPPLDPRSDSQDPEPSVP